MIILVVLISFAIVVVIGEGTILVVLISFAIVVEILNFSFTIHGVSSFEFLEQMWVLVYSNLTG